MMYTVVQIRKASRKIGLSTLQEFALIYALEHPVADYDDSRVYFEEERARDQRLDCNTMQG